MNTVNYFTSMLKASKEFAKHNVKWEYTATWNESLISRARNRLVDDFLKNFNQTHACFIDADIGFEPVDLMALMELDLDVVAAPCSKKSIRWDRIQDVVKKNGKTYSGDQLSRIGGDFVFNFEAFTGTRQLKILEPHEMRSMGTGLMMIKRDVFKKFMDVYPDRWYESRTDPAALPGPIWDFFKCGVNEDTREYDSEDYWFCHDVKKMGCKVFMAPWVKTTHMGTYTFVGDMAALAAVGTSF